ncbi:hypothetical protein Gasu2_29820 [Galdieria sulphuraria]|nr:hypothetical protein Gasu2_29820 [Galdieria sulphuraria]
MAYLFYHRLLHTSVLKSGKSRRYRIRYYFTQTINFIEEQTNHSQQLPVVSQVVVNSFEALWFQKKLVTLIVAIWIVLRVIAVIPLLPEALELTGLVTSVIVFYRYQTDRGVQEQVAFCIERVKTLLQQYFHH